MPTVYPLLTHSMNPRPIIIEGDIARVPLTQGYETIIDATDVPLIDGWNWYAQICRRRDGSIKTVYAVRSALMDGVKWRQVLMHRVLLGAPDDREVDHWNSDGLNNCRSNIRLATASQNQHNGRIRIDNVSGVKGVAWDKACGKWLSYIMLNRRRRHLGSFDTIAEAAVVRAKAVVEFHGEFGRIV